MLFHHSCLITSSKTHFVKVAASTTDNHVFFEMNDGLPTKQEVLITAVVLASSSNASDDEILTAWATATITLSGIASSPNLSGQLGGHRNSTSLARYKHTFIHLYIFIPFLVESKYVSTKSKCDAKTQQVDEINHEVHLRIFKEELT